MKLFSKQITKFGTGGLLQVPGQPGLQSAIILGIRGEGRRGRGENCLKDNTFQELEWFQLDT